MDSIKLGSLVNNSITPLKQDNTLEEALKAMKESTISSVVITNELSKPIGIFTEHDALKIIANHTNKELKLKDIMTKDIFYVKEDIYIHDAYVLMEQRNFRHIIVVDVNNIYLGVVTEGDFLRHMGFEEMAKFKCVEDTMSKSILTIDPNTPIPEAAKLMSEKKCDYAIILNENYPSGIINERDITHYCSNQPQVEYKTIAVLNQHTMHLIKKSTSLQEASSMMKQHNVHQLIVVDDNDNLIGLITRHDILKTVHGAYFDFLLQTIENKTAHEEELQKLINYDTLTGLPNRLLFKNHLQKSIARAIRNKHILAVVIFDLDRFKDINDSYGHSIGDELLITVAKRLEDRVREGDVVARLGGDEFAVILEHVKHNDDVARVTKEMLENISSIYKLSNGVEVHVDSSAGIVIAPKDGKNVEEIFQHADSALYQAKNDGHGLYRYYTDEMTKKARKKMAYENRLRFAIQKGELELYYQPQVHFQTNKIVAAEALLRWNDKDEGIIPPSVFIPIAEETGLINKIGEWVINETCKQGKTWLDKGYHLTLAVNVSANQVRYQNIPEVVSNALADSGYTADKLELEITESALMQREEEVVSMLHSLKAKGIRLAIDDFGTGYSSLSYLKRFPIDVLKIDKSFIDDIPYQKDDIAIVIAIIEMGKALGYQVLAEGTEQQEQLDFLKDKGCNLYQGYIKSKPIKADEFERLLEEQNS